MYDELVKQLRYCGSGELCQGCPFKSADRTIQECIENNMKQAADAIEELNKTVKHQAEIPHLYGGETGIRQSAKMNDSLLRLLQAKFRWIPVTERLPHLMTLVLITDGIEVDTALMYGVPARWAVGNTNIGEDKITHWMPMPKTPTA